MRNEPSFKELLMEAFGDNPISWMKWIVVLVVFILSFYILVFKIFGKIWYKADVERKIEKAQAKGNVLRGTLVDSYVKYHEDSLQRTFVGRYQYELKGVKHKYSTSFPLEMRPPKVINLYYINSPKRLFCKESYRHNPFLGILYLIGVIFPFAIAGFVAKLLGLINV